jgi:hypothetical protein
MAGENCSSASYSGNSRRVKISFSTNYKVAAQANSLRYQKTGRYQPLGGLDKGIWRSLDYLL